jgi:cytochrome c556
MFKRLVLVAITGGATLFVAANSFAQLNPKEAIAARVNGYRETGAAFKTINDQLKSDTPAKIMLRISAKRIVQTTHEQYDWFPAGSGREAGEKTKAKPVVWSDAAGFKAAQDRFQQQAALLSDAIEHASLSDVRKQSHALGEACAACHTKYRLEE